ncbi:Dicer-like protein 1 [Mucor velutinosus]|uniref:Dicer-like protein 1 n=1 Tax=Mucor velutinosus TaxID=708070 RepID=A0AAN7DII1_9FUNG|nr:Dicer-like protein 1 [Mucor velutinosus]
MSIVYIDNPPPKYRDQLKNQIKKFPAGAKSYFRDFFPIANWLPNYNLIWLSGDLTAAITVGTLVIPQSLAYAKIARLPPVFGLYTSFIGTILYPLFGTSKDVSIGVSAITSLLVGQVIGKLIESEQYISGAWTMADAAITLSLFSGLIVLAIGVFRLGAIYQFICQPAIAGFMAGSGLTIVINQFNKIFGIPNINTSEAPYLVFGKTLINLHHSTVDAAFGVSALIYLYGVKYLAQYLMRKYPQHNRLIFFFNTSRSIVVLVFGTLLCFMINHFGQFSTSPIKIIGDVPAGFNHMAVPVVKPDLLGFFASDLPGIVVLLVMEHGAISTSLGKVQDYRVNMSQELFSNGLGNVLGAFFCSYPGTGAFARSAVMSKSGARTPLASFFVGIIVVLAIYVFTPAFKYIPMASLSAIIAHSVTDLIFGPTVWRKFWELNPMELLVFACAYIIALFTRIDIAVYVPVVLSVLVQLYRSARPGYAVLGRVDLDPELGDIRDEKHTKQQEIEDMNAVDTLDNTLFFPENHPILGSYVKPVDSGIVCFQPQENVVFQNAAFTFDKLFEEIERTTRRGKLPAEKMGDRPWNNTEGVGKSQLKPLLHSVVLDLSGVHQMDYSGMEALTDAAVAAERYSGQHVHWYIVTGESMAVRKSLLFAGFGNQRSDGKTPGRFLSDLRHGVPEDGHRPGVEGCRSYDPNAVTNHDDEKNDFEQVVVIEQVEVQQRRPSFIHKAMGRSNQSSSTLDQDQQTQDFSTTPCNDSAQWCYCHNTSIAPNVRITAVHDRFPFFFRSLHEAVRAALIGKAISASHLLDNISVISDRDETTSPGESSSS